MGDTLRQHKTSSDLSRLANRERALRERYGNLLTLNDLACVLRYPSVHAIRKAHSRGRLPLPLVKMPPRRGWFATPLAVAELLESLDSDPAAASVDMSSSAEEDVTTS